jgi:hypothetical protein
LHSSVDGIQHHAGAKQAILFLVFLPARFGNQSIIAEAVQVGQEEKGLFVIGAISDASALPNRSVTVLTMRPRSAPFRVLTAEASKSLI